MKKILFIFSGSRKVLNESISKGQAPDTQLYGMNHLSSDFEVSSKEFSDTFLGRILGNKIDFRIKHFLMYFYIGSADIIFGSSILYMAILKKVFLSKKKFVLLNISLNRLLNKTLKNQPIFYKSIKSLLSEIDIIVSLSNFQNNQLNEIHKINVDKLKYLPLGVDINFYKPVYENRKDYILSVGRDNGRDYKTVIELARLLPDREFHLVLSQRNIKNIDNIPTNVKVFFDISLSELRTKYQEASMLLLITHPDGFDDGSDCSGQTVLLDCFACGLPVIATKKAYINDYGEHKKHLLLVKPYDTSDIINGIEEIKLIGQSLARNARLRVESEFTTEKMGDRLSTLFNKI